VPVSSKVPRAPIVEARVACPCSLRMSRQGRLLWVYWWTWSYLLRCTVAPLWRWRRTTWLAYGQSVEHVVLGQCAHKRSWSGPLALLIILGGTDGILLPNVITHELVEGLALDGHQVLTDLCGHPLAKQGHLLHIGVGVV
jgi:hypothetical protein